uniref:Phosphoglucomutase n=1 Tax=Meloidogyne javanica TaxID=6303 RepID=A0A915MSK5_MELJA
MDEELQKLIKNWFEWDKNEDTRSQIQKLVDTSNLVELKALMIGELSFGTAGVRTKMGPGFTQLNDLTIIQLSHGMAQHLLQDMASKGNNKIPKIVVGFDGRHNSLRELNAKTSLKFTYSAFHGVGSKFARRMFKEFGFTEDAFSYVKEQDEPNPDFPTVSFPNPEEGHAVLKLCYQTAEETGATLILANDPDADRLQIAERQPDEDWHLFNGNEMGFKNDVSLTGFKWIGNLAHEIRKKGRLVILAWEESIGFATGTTLDKDGVSAAAVFAEMANYLASQKLNMKKQLFNIYNKYGFHLIRNSYWTVPKNSVTKKLFNNLRENGKYPVNIDGNKCEEKYVVKHVRDLNTGFDSSQPNNKAILPLSTTSDMITFTLASGSLVTLRASGTEPKIKYYIELQTEPGKTENDLEQVENELNQLENNVVQTLLQPEKYGLICR